MMQGKSEQVLPKRAARVELRAALLFLAFSCGVHLSILFLVLSGGGVEPPEDRASSPAEENVPEAFSLLGQAIEVTQEELGEDLQNKAASRAVSQAIPPSQALGTIKPITSGEKSSQDLPSKPAILVAPKLIGKEGSSAKSGLKASSVANSPPDIVSSSRSAQDGSESNHSEAAQRAAALGVQAVREGRAQLSRAFAKTLPQAAAAQADLKLFQIGVQVRARIKITIQANGRLESLQVLSSSDPKLGEILRRNALFLKRGRYQLSPDKVGSQKLLLTLRVQQKEPSIRYEEGAKDLSDALGILESPRPDQFRTPRGAFLRLFSGRYFEFLIQDISPEPKGL